MKAPKLEERATAADLIQAILVLAAVASGFVKAGLFGALCSSAVALAIVWLWRAFRNPPDLRERPPQAESDDPVGWVREIQEHRYDPGHWTGGNLDPVYRSPSVRRYGWLLLVAALISLVFGASCLSPRSGIPLFGAVFILAVGVAQLTGGIRLLSRHAEQTTREEGN